MDANSVNDLIRDLTQICQALPAHVAAIGLMKCAAIYTALAKKDREFFLYECEHAWDELERQANALNYRARRH